jgi:uncharacterized protein YbaR (Trm112 family)
VIRKDLWCPVCRASLQVKTVPILTLRQGERKESRRRFLWCKACRMGIRIMRVHGNHMLQPKCHAHQDGRDLCHLNRGHTGPHEDTHGRCWKVVSV